MTDRAAVRRVYVLCNAMSDAVRLRRGITTDSPAATRKIVMMMQALREAGVKPVIFSLGRGRQDGSGAVFPAVAARIGGVPVAYGRFVSRPIMSQLHSLVAPLPWLWRRRRHARDTTLLLYNRMPSHLPALWFARALGYRTMLDLEDGATVPTPRARALTAATDAACTDGALLACAALRGATRLRPAIPYYGVVEAAGAPRDFTGGTIAGLIGGTVGRITGADMLADAIALLRDHAPEAAATFHLHVSGSGDMIERFRTMARDARGPRITVHGRLTDAAYAALLERCDIGFALKPNAGALADTTFPSKVVELAGAGMLVLTTDISDVRAVLGDAGAVYLERDDAGLLRERILTILDDRRRAAGIARAGQAAVRARCGRAAAGAVLTGALSGQGAGQAAGAPGMRAA